MSLTVDDRLTSTGAKIKIFMLRVGSCLGILGIAAPAIAQVIPDATLSTTVITTDNLNFVVGNGTQIGSNLFHSFDQFSIPTGGSAVFNPAPDVGAIFSRVTGALPSSLDGELSSGGTADLFLLNPNGILFGPNARLNLGGSFIASTADSILFGDGAAFSVLSATASATATAATSVGTGGLLSISTPVGLHMGANSGDIRVQGSGHTMTYPQGVVIPFDRSQSPRGLEVLAGESLHLIGRNLQLDSGVLTAEAGRIELAAIAPTTPVALSTISSTTQSTAPSPTPPQVNLIPENSGWRLSYGDGELGHIQLRERALLDASGGGFNSGSGSIHLQAAQVELVDASTLLLQNFGTAASGAISVNATESLSVMGTSSIGPTISEIRTESLGPGRGGYVDIVTRELLIQDSAPITTATFSPASGGDLRIEVSDRSQIGGPAPSNASSLANASFVATSSLGPGNAGNLDFLTRELVLHDGGFVASTILADGAGGNVAVNATESIDINGINPLTLGPSGINVITLGTGNAGELTVDAPRIRINNGGSISSSTQADGNAGTLTVNATESLEIKGQTNLAGQIIPSEITSGSERTTLPEANRIALGIPLIPSGKSGRLLITTPSLEVSEGGSISVRNDGVSSDAGSLEVQAKDILIRDQSQITATAQQGQGGDIRMVAETLQLRDESQINASTQSGQGGNIKIDALNTLLTQSSIEVNGLGAGGAGNLDIASDRIILNHQASLQAQVVGGNQGNIVLQAAEAILLRDQSNITTNATNSASGGNISINTPLLIGLENSDIIRQVVK